MSQQKQPIQRVGEQYGYTPVPVNTKAPQTAAEKVAELYKRLAESKQPVRG